MSKVEAGYRYTKNHEWAKVEGGLVRVGITDYAQDSLSDIVYVELPAPGKKCNKDETLGVVESVKSVSDVYAPVAGTVSAVNDALSQTADLLNKDPHGQGWIVRIKIKDKKALEALMTAGDYEKFLEGLEH